MNLPRLSVASSADERPLYIQVKEALLTNLENGIWKPDEQLPTETEISHHMGVSEGTVRQAVLSLAKEGRIHRRSGKGTFVSRINFDQSFARFFRFKGNNECDRSQYNVTTIGAEIQQRVDPHILQLLQLNQGDNVVVLHRAISIDNVVVCHYRSYLSESRFPDLVSLPLDDTGLYNVLEQQYGVHVVGAKESLNARIAKKDDALILDLPQNEAVIAINRTAFTYKNEIIEVRRTVGRSDKFRYDIRLG